MTTKLQASDHNGAPAYRWNTEFDRIHVWNPAAVKSPTARGQERIRHYRAPAGSGPPRQFDGG
jgi:hypothetical protein